MRIGVQLFTVRKSAKKDLYSTLAELAKLGVLHVEAARIAFDKQSANDFYRAKEEFGTTVVATQIKFCELSKNFDEVLNFHKQTGCVRAIISVMPTECIIGGERELKKFCSDASELAKAYKDNGIQLCYHHHDFEFIKINGKTKYDIVLDNMSDIKMVLDTYWLTKAGYYVPSMIEKLSGRVEGLHLRDYALTSKFILCHPKDAALGDGVIDFGDIIECAKDNGVSYGAIEQNTKVPFEEIKRSVKHLQKLGYEDCLNKEGL